MDWLHIVHMRVDPTDVHFFKRCTSRFHFKRQDSSSLHCLSTVLGPIVSICTLHMCTVMDHDCLWVWIHIRHYKDSWAKLIKRCMKQDFSWEKSALKYVEVFKKVNIQPHKHNDLCQDCLRMKLHELLQQTIEAATTRDSAGMIRDMRSGHSICATEMVEHTQIDRHMCHCSKMRVTTKENVDIISFSSCRPRQILPSSTHGLSRIESWHALQESSFSVVVYDELVACMVSCGWLCNAGSFRHRTLFVFQVSLGKLWWRKTGHFVICSAMIPKLWRQ